MFKSDINLLLSECEGHTRKYWPDLVIVQTEHSEVCTKTNLGQYSPVRLEQARLVSTYMLFTSREVRIGKNCARGLEYGPRPQVEGCTRDRGHSFSQYEPNKAGE